MAGTWESQNKILPGAYINIRTNEPLSITPGDRGTVVILQEVSTGNVNDIYTVTAVENEWLKNAVSTDKKLAVEALKKAKKVLVYKLPENHTQEHVEDALVKLKTISFNVLCYPYDGDEKDTNKTVIASFIKTMREEEGIKCQAVLANYSGDSEGILNVVQGIVLSDNTELTAAETTAWAAGATAGAGFVVSNTGAAYEGAIDIIPRMTKTQMETAILAGQFIFKADQAQNVTVVYDINSLTTFTSEKGSFFRKNRVIRTTDSIANDITSIYESSYIGKISNNDDGRALLKGSLLDYFSTLQGMGAIQNYDAADVIVEAGKDSDAVLVTVAVQPVDSIEKIYITVNLS